MFRGSVTFGWRTRVFSGRPAGAGKDPVESPGAGRKFLNPSRGTFPSGRVAPSRHERRFAGRDRPALPRVLLQGRRAGGACVLFDPVRSKPASYRHGAGATDPGVAAIPYGSERRQSLPPGEPRRAQAREALSVLCKKEEEQRKKAREGKQKASQYRNLGFSLPMFLFCPR